MTARQCTACDRPHHALGLCAMHYTRQRRWSRLQIPLVCTCPMSRPRPFPECDICQRAAVYLWPPERAMAAMHAYPELRDQEVDWTLRIEALYYTGDALVSRSFPEELAIA